jgi:hypothetical protein
MREFVLANGTVFPSKGAAKRYFKEVLETQWPEGLIPKHLESNMRAVLRHHIFQDQIVGPGIKHYEVRENESGRCFYAVRVDGTVVPLGVHQAIYPLGYGSRDPVHFAMWSGRIRSLYDQQKVKQNPV